MHILYVVRTMKKYPVFNFNQISECHLLQIIVQYHPHLGNDRSHYLYKTSFGSVSVFKILRKSVTIRLRFLQSHKLRLLLRFGFVKLKKRSVNRVFGSVNRSFPALTPSIPPFFTVSSQVLYSASHSLLTLLTLLPSAVAISFPS